MHVSFAVNGCIYEMLFITNIEHTSIMSPELMKLRIMIVSIKTKVLIKFGTSEIMCVDLRAKKLRNMYRFPLTYAYVKCSSSHA